MLIRITFLDVKKVFLKIHYAFQRQKATLTNLDLLHVLACIQKSFLPFLWQHSQKGNRLSVTIIVPWYYNSKKQRNTNTNTKKGTDHVQLFSWFDFQTDLRNIS